MDAAKYRPEEPGREQCCVCWWMPLAVRYGKIARIADPAPDTKLLLARTYPGSTTPSSMSSPTTTAGYSSSNLSWATFVS